MVGWAMVSPFLVLIACVVGVVFYKGIFGGDEFARVLTILIV